MYFSNWSEVSDSKEQLLADAKWTAREQLRVYLRRELSGGDVYENILMIAWDQFDAGLYDEMNRWLRMLDCL